ncbi:hypothetical protein F5B22DRAFT_137800 [Xylaria bambusicola]|uniref:uncharacterized protein n=1 Tax=Xylaria bambusicola TaxID=326684 RepID=UPI002007F092|nr:uncharacterized protein F5B22DRAFT_137800 [Xylaria bambusicola]KAI0516919.1 hypothetical protein F5B22DRAFT_137800 [Xylaria bambusicola]
MGHLPATWIYVPGYLAAYLPNLLSTILRIPFKLFPYSLIPYPAATLFIPPIPPIPLSSIAVTFHASDQPYHHSITNHPVTTALPSSSLPALVHSSCQLRALGGIVFLSIVIDIFLFPLLLLLEPGPFPGCRRLAQHNR